MKKKSPKPPQLCEHEIQNLIIEYLEKIMSKDVYFVRNNSFAGSFKRPNGSYGWIKNNKKGTPDIIACLKSGRYGIMVGWEIKSEKGKISEFQKQAKQDIESLGGYYFIIKSLDDLISSINYVRERVSQLQKNI